MGPANFPLAFGVFRCDLLRRLGGAVRTAGRPVAASSRTGTPVRGFVSLLFAAALAAHLGPAGAPSLGGGPTCADEAGVGDSGRSHLLYPAAVLGVTQAEAKTDGRERTGGTASRRVAPQAGTNPAHVGADGTPRVARPSVPGWLLGLVGHPTTAPPLQA